MTAIEEEQIYSIALTMVPGVGHIGAKRLVEGMKSATDVFRFRKELPDRLSGVSERVAQALDCPPLIARAEQELHFLQKKQIHCLTYYDEAYPSRLRECEDAPVVLFYKGNADLNALHIINMVGTRHATDYGTQLCNTFLRDLKALCPDVLVVSGLAYGIDINAHRAALDNDLSTVGVLAHGLDRIYPSLHRKTAVDMLDKGGLLTEFVVGTSPDKHNFVSRNRIVAGMCDATIVVESAAKGGSLITAELAESYHRDCFAFPGRAADEYSKGCNQLIRDNKASLLLSAEDFVKAMDWNTSSPTGKPTAVQRDLFPDLSEEEQRVVDLLTQRGNLQINTLVVETDIPIHKMTALLFELEMKGMIRVLAGGMYQLLA